MRTEEAFYNISMYLYNKNVLQYAQIAPNETESKLIRFLILKVALINIHYFISTLQNRESRPLLWSKNLKIEYVFRCLVHYIPIFQKMFLCYLTLIFVML